VAGGQLPPNDCDARRDVQADIVFEDGQPLPCSVAPPHLCQPELATIGHGRARVSLRIGRNVLSSKLGKRRLRIRFRPRHPTLRSWYPGLTAFSEPFKAVAAMPRLRPRSPVEESNANHSSDNAAPGSVL